MSISRIESAKDPTRGFCVPVGIDGGLHSRFFQDGSSGGAWAAAEAHEASLIAGRGPQRERRPGRRNTSGVTVVPRCVEPGTGPPLRTTTWMDGSGRQRRARFTVNKVRRGGGLKEGDRGAPGGAGAARGAPRGVHERPT